MPECQCRKCGRSFDPRPAHRLLCGDSREAATVAALFEGAKANVAITSPPYAAQREYDSTSGFKPVRPDEYVEWFGAVAAGVQSILAPDGSYFLNIKEHADDGERDLYVMDLVIAHRRGWGWRFVDQFCWRKTDNGVPGGWGNRFKNAWEPVFHFCRQQQIKFRPQAVSHESEDCFDYSPNNPKSNSGSGLLGTGARGAAADGGKNQSAWQRSRNSLSDDSDGRHTGLARPSNVIEVKSESSQGSHSAPFPRALVEFFLLAYSDPGDVVFDPFMGSGTTMAAAHVLGRAGYGCEISPAYCDVIVRRLAALGCHARLASTGQTFAEVESERLKPAEVAACEKAARQARLIELEPKYCDVIVRRWQEFTGKQATLAGHGATFEHVREGRRLGAQDDLKNEAMEAGAPPALADSAALDAPVEAVA